MEQKIKWWIIYLYLCDMASINIRHIVGDNTSFEYWFLFLFSALAALIVTDKFFGKEE